MKYSRPEVTHLGDAASVIQHTKRAKDDAEAPLDLEEINLAYEPEE